MESSSNKQISEPNNEQSSSSDSKSQGSAKSRAAKSEVQINNRKKGKKSKKSNKSNKPSITSQSSSDTFSFEEIVSSKEASAHIRELVKCFTSNSHLPPEELCELNQDLYEKTVSMFSFLLNTCEQKILSTVLSMDCFREILEKSKIEHKSVSCQTDISYGNLELTLE